MPVGPDEIHGMEHGMLHGHPVPVTVAAAISFLFLLLPRDKADVLQRDVPHAC